MSKEIAVFQIAFLEGELEVDSKDDIVRIPVIKEQKMINWKMQTMFDMKDIIIFKRTDRKINGKPLFVKELNKNE